MTEPDPTATQAATPDQNKRSADISGAFQPTPTPTGERYEFRDLLATGGMGAVYHAWDTHLKRDIAVKLIHGAAASDFARRRFGHEASITAQLQHPGIPPVYDQGTLADGRPFLAMKLVKGKTLDDLLKQRPDPAHDRGRFVAIFEAIGHALGYTHSKGVIHRDLKPLNIMVGAFGEVQVMDWGLAKFRGEATDLTAESSAASTFFDPRADDDSKTGAGSFLGTPAYMPPEQAAGAIENVTERSDVFGLGAILCTILTGHPPFRGSTGESTRLLAAQGKVEDAFARLDASGAEPELIALAKRCLAVDPQQRPANGSVVADDVAKLRADAESRAKQAEVAKAASDTRRRVLAWSAVAVVLTLAAGAGAAVWQAVRATTAQTAAQRRLELASGVIGNFVHDVDYALAAKEVPQTIRLQVLQSLQENLKQLLAEADPADPGTQRLRAAYHSKLGDLRFELGEKAPALAEYEASLAIARRLVDARPADADNLLYLGLCMERLGRWHADNAAFAAALGYYQESLAVRTRLHELDPERTKTVLDISSAWVKIGGQFLALDQLDAARQAVDSADAWVQPVLHREPKNLKAIHQKAYVLDNSGFVYEKLKDNRKALSALQETLTHLQQLTDLDPGTAHHHHDIATIARRAANIARAIPDEAVALAMFQRERDALHAYQQIVFNQSKAMDRREELATSYIQIGILRAKRSDYEAALRAFEIALALRTTVQAEKPDDRLPRLLVIAVQVELPTLYVALADQKKAANDPAGAEADRAEAHRLYRSVANEYAKLPPPPAAHVPQDLGICMVLFGRAYTLDKPKEARDWAAKWVYLAKHTPGLPTETQKQIPQMESVVQQLEADLRPK